MSVVPESLSDNSPAASEPQADLGGTPAPAPPVAVSEAPTTPPAPPSPSPLPPEDVDDASLVADPDRDEVERLLASPPGHLTLVSGTQVVINPLKLREFLQLIKIVTRGATAQMPYVDLDFEDPQAFMQNLLALVLFAVPEAPEETVAFLQTVCSPAGLTGDPDSDRYARELVMAELENPELEDTIEVLTSLIRSEGQDLHRLGKRLRVMFKTAQKLGALDKTP